MSGIETTGGGKPASAQALERLGKYELRGVLGKGAMGVVYDGWDPMIERRVAIKTARLPDADDVDAQEELGRFRREAQAAGRLSHPNIVGVYDSGEVDGIAYFVMELVEGRSLKAMLEGGNRLAVPEAVRIMTDVLSGLNYSHARGVIHRDIKPANIMMTESGEAKIADFGIARIESSSMTQAGTVMGTPAYMSPEQFMGQTVDSRTDIYSAGVMLYQLLTGERPFEGSMTAIMHKALNTVPPKPSELSVNVKPALDMVVARAMARRPEDRYATAADFSAALRDAAEAADVPIGPVDEDATMVVPGKRPVPVAVQPQVRPAPEPATASSSGRGKLIAGAVAAVVLLAGVGGYFALSGSPPPKPVVMADPKPEPQKPVQLPDTVVADKPADKPADTQVAVAEPPRVPERPDPAVQLAAAALALRDVPCSLADAGAGSDGSVQVTGLVGLTQLEALRHRVEQAAPGATVRVSTFSGPYCRVVNMARGVADGPAMSLSMRGNITRLHDEELIAPIVTIPSAPSYVRLDYFSNDGSVTHLYPSASTVEHPFASGMTWVPVPDQWKVGKPFGTDMVMVVASSAPLFAIRRANPEPIETYAAALQAGVDALRRRGGTVSARVQVLDTEP